jgi:hypothetical protein
VIRVSHLQLTAQRLAGPALVLSPNTYLKNQIADENRFNQALERYEILLGFEYGFRKLDEAALPFTPNDEKFLPVTMQLVNTRLDIFEQWVRFEVNRTGLAPVVYVDEAHTGSEDNSWGESVQKLAEAGAFVVLLTATPVRSDGKAIPGFEINTSNSQPVKVNTPNRSKEAPEGYVWIDVMEGQRQQIELVAHHRTTFREAWDAEDPPALCKVGRLPFDLELTNVINSQEFERGLVLSELSESDARRWLGQICRSPVAIDAGCHVLATVLRDFRGDKADCAAIVFCGNDQEKDEQANKHARDIEGALSRLSPTLRIRIATTSIEGDAGEIIRRFVEEGDGDVLIVKQMASVGLDSARLKVCLDLSSVRTAASYIQRMMRVCTIYDNLHHGVYISPDDVVGRALFQSLVVEQGGAARTSGLTVVDSFLVAEKEPILETLVVDGARDASFEDSNSNKAEAEERPRVDQWLSILGSKILRNFSHAEIAVRTRGLRIEPENRAEERTFSRVVDVGARIKDVKKEAGQFAHSIASRRLRADRLHGEEGDFGDIVRAVWNEHKGKAGIPLSMTIERVNDLRVLEALRDSLKATWESEERGKPQE